MICLAQPCWVCACQPCLDCPSQVWHRDVASATPETGNIAPDLKLRETHPADHLVQTRCVGLLASCEKSILKNRSLACLLGTIRVPIRDLVHCLFTQQNSQVVVKGLDPDGVEAKLKKYIHVLRGKPVFILPRVLFAGS